MSVQKEQTRSAYIALISVLIIGAVILVISIGVASRSISETQMSFSEQQSHKALALANLCAEHALLKLGKSLDYTGGELITVDEESCDVLAVQGSGSANRTIKAQSIVSGYIKKVKVEVLEVLPVIQIASWEEVADF